MFTAYQTSMPSSDVGETQIPLFKCCLADIKISQVDKGVSAMFKVH